ncbi:MAG: ferredoxin--NADP reductase, partial [Candidatus Saccharimonadales bacterium]
IYGLLVGGIFISQFHFGIIGPTPELALIAGNIFAYIASPKRKLNLKLKARKELAPGVYDFAFVGNQKLAFQPGQYLEWTLGNVDFDSRGNRRTFSIASAPDDAELHIGIKTYQPGSNFKKALLAMQPGDHIAAGQLAGNFTLPRDNQQKLAFIAGGIGITPFVSMAKDMIKRQQNRDVVLFYLVSKPAEFCYQEVWKQAANFGVRVVPVLTSDENPPSSWLGRTGRLTDEILRKELPDYTKRRYYISGPNALVQAYTSILIKLKISRRSIVTDHFSGY